MMETKLFKTGDVIPVSGNYQFVKHEKDAPNCVLRYGAYLHMMKGMKLPLHDDCQQSAFWRQMTVTDEHLLEKTMKLPLNEVPRRKP